MEKVIENTRPSSELEEKILSKALEIKDKVGKDKLKNPNEVITEIMKKTHEEMKMNISWTGFQKKYSWLRQKLA